MVMIVGHVGFLEEGAQGRLELPVGRLQELLGLIGRTAGGQYELVDHHLVLQLVHVDGHGARTGRPVPFARTPLSPLSRRLSLR